MIKELTIPNLDALEKITESLMDRYEKGTYLYKEAEFANEMVILLRARVVADLPSEATGEALEAQEKVSWWKFWRKW